VLVRQPRKFVLDTLAKAYDFALSHFALGGDMRATLRLFDALLFVRRTSLTLNGRPLRAIETRELRVPGIGRALRIRDAFVFADEPGGTEK
jgi:hypothetical protein